MYPKLPNNDPLSSWKQRKRTFFSNFRKKRRKWVKPGWEIQKSVIKNKKEMTSVMKKNNCFFQTVKLDHDLKMFKKKQFWFTQTINEKKTLSSKLTKKTNTINFEKNGQELISTLKKKKRSRVRFISISAAEGIASIITMTEEQKTSRTCRE